MIITQGFRYDINGLRAFAVFVVLFFHFKVPFFAGGFSGVDIFYVISGYLMTKIITTGIEKDNFSLLTFYRKRIQRIIPGLTAIILEKISWYWSIRPITISPVLTSWGSRQKAFN